MLVYFRSLFVALITVSILITAAGISRRSPVQIREECGHIVEALQLCDLTCGDVKRLAAGFTPELIHIRTSLPG